MVRARSPNLTHFPQAMKSGPFAPQNLLPNPSRLAAQIHVRFPRRNCAHHEIFAGMVSMETLTGSRPSTNKDSNNSRAVVCMTHPYCSKSTVMLGAKNPRVPCANSKFQGGGRLREPHLLQMPYEGSILVLSLQFFVRMTRSAGLWEPRPLSSSRPFKTL